MSKINLTPNASGTGVFTIASPNSNTDYTLTLPEVTGGDFIVSDSSGNVTIGGTTPGNAGTINVTVGSPGSTVGGLQLWSTTSGSHFMQFGDTASGDGYYRGAIGYLHASDALVSYSAGAERMRIDGSGNVGVGVTPEAWSTYTPIQVQQSSLASFTNGDARLTNNAYYSSGWKYIDSRYATQYLMDAGNGIHTWSTATSGTADGAVTWSERMRIDNAGNVGIGTTSPSTYDSRTNNLVVGDSGDAGITIFSGATSNAYLQFAPSGDTGLNNGLIDYDNNNDSMAFATGGSERMRVDSSGNVLVGQTAAYSGTGTTIGPNGELSNATASGVASSLNIAGIVGVSNGFQITTNTSNQHEYTFLNGGSVAAKIDTSGNVGIGTTSPGARLDLVGPSSTPVVLEVNSANSNCDVTMQSASTSSATRLRNGTNDFQVHTNGTERMRIDSSGNLLVGCTADPSSSVKGMGYGDFAVAGYDTCLVLAAGANTSTDRQISFVNGNGLVGNINTSGTSTTYATSSDQRLKENIVDAPAGNIDAIRVRSFDWKADGSHQTYGMVAQELVDVAPEAVTQGQTEDDMWGVDYSKLVPMMIKEIQDLKAKLAALEAR